MLSALAREGTRGEDLVREGDEEEADRRGHERQDVCQGRCGQRRAGQAARDRADGRDAVACEVEQPGEGDRADDHDQRPRHEGQEAAQAEHRAERGDADGERGGARIAKLPHDLPEPLEGLARVDLEP